jgi:cholesterol transport system auxiliary component
MTPALGAVLLLGGCVGSLLGGGKPDALYRFGNAPPVATSAPALPAPRQQTVVLLKAGFAAEVGGDRVLTTHAGSARYIKGMRWVAGAPGLFTQAMARSFETRAPGLRFTTTQGGDLTGYALALAISRFEAQYGGDAMTSPPTVLIEGDATLYGLSDRKEIATRRFTAQAAAGRNAADDIAAAFDQATTAYTAQVSDWAVAAAAENPR